MIDASTLGILRQQLIERDADLLQQVTPLEEERATIRQQIELVDQLIGLEQKRAGTPPSESVPASPSPAPEPRSTGFPSTPDAATLMLGLFESIGRPLHRSEIAELVSRYARQLGIERVPAESTLLARLANDPAKRFRSAGRRGYWAPASWSDDRMVFDDVGRRYLNSTRAADYFRRRWVLVRTRVADLMAQAAVDPASGTSSRRTADRLGSEADRFASAAIRSATRAHALAEELGDRLSFYPPPIDISDVQSAVQADARGGMPIEQLTVQTD